MSHVRGREKDSYYQRKYCRGERCDDLEIYTTRKEIVTEEEETIVKDKLNGGPPDTVEEPPCTLNPTINTDSQKGCTGCLELSKIF